VLVQVVVNRGQMDGDIGMRLLHGGDALSDLNVHPLRLFIMECLAALRARAGWVEFPLGQATCELFHFVHGLDYVGKVVLPLSFHAITTSFKI